MDIKSILRFVFDPKILSIVGGYAGYRFAGKGKPGYQPYLYGAGGMAAGYGIGKLLQKYLAPPAAPQAELLAAQAAAQAAAGLDMRDYVDLDGGTAPRALPAAPQQATVAAAPPPVFDVRGASADDGQMLDSLGTFNGSGESGLGSYGASLDGDVDAVEALREHGWNPRKN